MASSVGFIGLGQMGYPLARRLAAGGWAILAVDPASAAAARIAALPAARHCRSPAEAVAGADVVFTCLPTEGAVRDVYFGRDGILAAARPGLVTADCSTITPDLAIELGRRLAGVGIRHLDAPVFGTPQHAARGDAYFCLSGALAALTVVQPCLLAMGRAWKSVGGSGNASRIKLIQNALGYVNAVATAEALALARLCGVESEDFVAVVRDCDGIGNSTYFQRYAEFVAAGRDGGGGRLAIAAKDIHLLAAMAEGIGLSVPVMTAAERTYAEAVQLGLAAHEFTEVARVIERRAGRALFYPPEPA